MANVPAPSCQERTTFEVLDFKVSVGSNQHTNDDFLDFVVPALECASTASHQQRDPDEVLEFEMPLMKCMACEAVIAGGQDTSLIIQRGDGPQEFETYGNLMFSPPSQDHGEGALCSPCTCHYMADAHDGDDKQSDSHLVPESAVGGDQGEHAVEKLTHIPAEYTNFRAALT